jgi:CO/xanthine dehydrogenase Mo-binding subunit
METTTFTAVCQRAGRWWAIRVLQIEGLAAQVRSLDQAEMMTRQSIARTLGVPPETIRVEVRTETSNPVSEALQAREAARQAAEAAAEATRVAIESLLRDGCTVRDMAILLGLTPTEIAQLAPGRDYHDGASGASPLAQQPS